MSEDKFTAINIDKMENEEKWDKPVPWLDYWRYSYKGVMSKEQSAFYKYFRDNIMKGRYVDINNTYGYVSVLKDELLKAYKARRLFDKTDIVMAAIALRNMYDYTGADLDNIINTQLDLVRAKRLNSYPKDKLAQWIDFGQTVEVDGETYTRGGFYLGTHLIYHKYDAYKGKFDKKGIQLEGPVVNLDENIVVDDKWRFDRYSTFVEMKDDVRSDYLDFLRGDDSSASVDILLYYLAGIEYRLLGDAGVTEEERTRLLYNIAILHDKVKDERIKRRCNDMIDLALALFFDNKTDDVVSYCNIPNMALVHAKRFYSLIKSVDVKSLSNKSLAEQLAEVVPISADLPTYYVDDFKKHLTEELSMELKYNRLHYWFNDSVCMYEPVESGRGYQADEMLKLGMKINFLKLTGREQIVMKVAMATVKNVWNQLGDFLYLIKRKVSTLSLINALPRWLDFKKLPGANEALDDIMPAEGEEYKIIQVAELVNLLRGTNYEASSNELTYPDDIGHRLSKYQLVCSYDYTMDLKLKMDDYLAIYRNQYDELPARGTLRIALYLVSWMMTADKVKDSDLIVIDRWLENYSDKKNFGVPAKALLRWLTSKKLSLTSKRKLKAAALAKSARRRQEFVDLLLEVMSDPNIATPKRMKRMATIYELMRLDPANIHSDMHRLTTGGRQTKAKSNAKGAKTTKLDKTLLKEIKKSTKKAQEMLADVFADETPQPEAPAMPQDVKTVNPMSQLISKLLEKSEWSRSEFEALSKEIGLTAGAALEQLNDLSYDTVGEAIAEDDGDTISVDLDVAQEMQNC